MSSFKGIALISNVLNLKKKKIPVVLTHASVVERLGIKMEMQNCFPEKVIFKK